VGTLGGRARGGETTEVLFLLLSILKLCKLVLIQSNLRRRDATGEGEMPRCSYTKPHTQTNKTHTHTHRERERDTDNTQKQPTERMRMHSPTNKRNTRRGERFHTSSVAPARCSLASFFFSVVYFASSFFSRIPGTYTIPFSTRLRSRRMRSISSTSPSTMTSGV
jgi:hypothetical protein